MKKCAAKACKDEINPAMYLEKGGKHFCSLKCSRTYNPPGVNPCLQHGLRPDPVNHPKHYTSHPSGVECITVVRHMTFNLGNAVKYIWRTGLKSDNPIQDLEKAIWYLKDEIERLRASRP